MTKIKKFDSFINEELRSETYRNAAEKLKQKGHHKRSNDILNFIENKLENINPVTFNINEKEYLIDYSNIKVYTENPSEDSIVINFTRPINDNINISDEEYEEYEENSVIKILHFPKTDSDGISFYTDGISLDRKNSRKLLMFLKEYFSYYGGPLVNKINNLTVNDLYES